MSYPSPTGEHFPGHTPGAHGGGAEPFAPTQRNKQYPQWSDATGYTSPPPPQDQPYQPQYQPYQPYQPAGAAPYTGYPQQYMPGARPTNPFAIASLILSIIGSGIIGVILGHIALSQIKRSNGYEQGHGLAVAGLIIGYAKIALGIIALIGFLSIILIASPSVPAN